MNLTNILDKLEYKQPPKRQHKKTVQKQSPRLDIIAKSFESISYDINKIYEVYKYRYGLLYDHKLVDPQKLSQKLKTGDRIRYSRNIDHLSGLCIIVKIVRNIQIERRQNDPIKQDDVDDFDIINGEYVKKKPNVKLSKDLIEYIVVGVPSLIGTKDALYWKIYPYTCFLFIAPNCRNNATRYHLRNLHNNLKLIDVSTSLIDYDTPLSSLDPIRDINKILANTEAFDE